MRLLAIGLFFSSIGLLGQNGKFPMGARNAGMGGATTTLGDQWSIFNNVGALGLLDGDAVFTSYQNRFNISELQVIGAGYVRDFGSTGIGLGVYRFGNELYSEQRINFALGHQLDRVSLGVGVDYLQYNISTVGTKGVLVFEFGGVAEITEKIHFGAHIFNLNQANLVAEENENLPIVMKAGLSFRPTEVLMINVETEKEIDFDEVFRVGLEYRIIENLYLRTGLNTEPFTGSFGVGFHPRQFQLDYSFSNDSNLGPIHDMSVSYLFQKK